MSVFIETRTDPFEEGRQAEVDRRQETRSPGNVRRPLRGIEIKQDTYAVLRVMKSDGTFINVIDAAGDVLEGESSVALTSHYTNFFIQQVAEERHEKQQIVDTFGDAFIFFFGEATRIVQVAGILLNTQDFNWRNEFWANYERYFRGTRLVEQGARLFLIYDDIIIEGYMLNANAQDDANRPNIINFSFSMFVTGYSTISALGDPHFPAPDDNLDYTQLTTYDQAVRRAQANRPIARETATQIAQRNLRRTTGAFLGSIGGLAAGIRNGIINEDTSIAGNIDRIRGAYSNVRQLAQRFRTNRSTGPTTNFPARTTPIRTTFQDNTDEYIGGSDAMTARQLASPLNMSERWQRMDSQADGFLENLIGGDVTSNQVFDLLGRGGRAIDEMRQRGSVGNYFRANSGRLYESSVRSIPFGMITCSGS